MPPAHRCIRIDESIFGGGTESQAVIMRENVPVAHAPIIQIVAARRSKSAYIVTSTSITNDRLLRRDIAVGDSDRTSIGATYRCLAAFEQRQTGVRRPMLQSEEPRGLRSPQHPRTTRPKSRLRNCCDIPLPRSQRINALPLVGGAVGLSVQYGAGPVSLSCARSASFF
jgi:hypothetical protein